MLFKGSKNPPQLVIQVLLMIALACQGFLFLPHQQRKCPPPFGFSYLSVPPTTASPFQPMQASLVCETPCSSSIKLSLSKVFSENLKKKKKTANKKV